ncbi:hypothetical protein A3I25_01005 [Candidatus Nomurabacteria bacterium RIFCSPLOWO2_02_FULL_42_17]|uniref:Serine protease n=2 Tax=Candidatus Nomuraibacteriota TaxID=1752729 RepID=A0A1F6WJE4_9BACT|nr:MAG: hypothetical protein A3B93_01345 [Candidatus Nomurabacteria bacterium RIFCSPHIGHO2_02_FULL_42_24]OGI96820.1 MAG: hypothetical protein A3I25_01005 [Candidatus Nomurabacteria bacterium RIFCSPLOWO2_02_FULL_42_17]
MDIKDLNKSQLILLAILVSFVVSIATGITTVTLMQQAPPPVTQTINRVVQKTIETVIPDTTQKVQTIIIKEEDLVVDAIEKNSRALVLVKGAPTEEDKDGPTLGRGFLVSATGLVLMDGRIISGDGKYSASYNNVTYEAEFLGKDKNGLALMKLILPKDSKIKSFEFTAFSDSDKARAGQSVIALGGVGLDIARGTILGFGEESLVEAPPVAEGDQPAGGLPVLEKIKTLNTNLTLSRSYSGTPVVDLDGSVLGFVLIRDSKTIIIPVNFLRSFIDNTQIKG